MASFVPNNEHLRHAMLLYFNQKKKASECYRLLLETYGEHAPSQDICERWFKRFKSGNFDLNNMDRGRPKVKFEDEELQALLDQDDRQSQEQMAEQLNVDQKTISRRLKAMGKVQKEGKWMPYELKPYDIARRLTMCEMLLLRFEKKSFLDRIVTGDEKWIYFDNPKRKKSWVDPGQSSTPVPKRNIHGKKVLLCIWWDQRGVLHYELLKPGETIDGPLYRRQLFRLKKAIEEKRPEFINRHGKIILQHDNARPHVAKVVKTALNTIGWEVLPYPPYSPDVAPSDYYLFRSMSHGLSEQRFTSYEGMKNWLDSWIDSKPPKFFWDGIHKLPRNWEKVVANEGRYIQ